MLKGFLFSDAISSLDFSCNCFLIWSGGKQNKKKKKKKKKRLSSSAINRYLDVVIPTRVTGGLLHHHNTYDEPLKLHIKPFGLLVALRRVFSLLDCYLVVPGGYYYCCNMHGTNYSHMHRIMYCLGSTL